jgi:hypothetical protein
MNSVASQYEYILGYQSLLHSDLLDYEPGKAFAIAIASNPSQFALATLAYQDVIKQNHESEIYEWAILQGYTQQTNPIVLLCKLFRQLRYLGFAPFSDGKVDCNSFRELPNWRNVPAPLSFLVSPTTLFYTRLKTDDHYEILSGLLEYESKLLDDVGEQYSRFYDSDPAHSQMAGKYLNEREFSWLSEFRAIGNLIELIGFKYMAEKQNHFEHT